jgi:hypothetical protein
MGSPITPSSKGADSTHVNGRTRLAEPGSLDVRGASFGRGACSLLAVPSTAVLVRSVRPRAGMGLDGSAIQQASSHASGDGRWRAQEWLHFHECARTNGKVLDCERAKPA